MPLWATKVAARGCAALEGYLRVEEVRSGVVWISWCDTAAGPERIAVVGLPTAEAKRAAIAIEDADPIGRLLDIDVYDSTGRSVSRYDLSLPPRRCLICDRPAHECARSRRHSLLELQRQIAKLLSAEAV